MTWSMIIWALIKILIMVMCCVLNLAAILTWSW